MRRIGITVVVAACWTQPPVTDQPKTPADRSAPTVDDKVELTGTLRVDPVPGPRHFQGVHLEVPGRGTFLVDYRARGVWRSFDGVQVVVTGACYQPSGQAIINRTHFRIDRLRAAKEERGRRPYLAIGPEQWLAGELLMQSGSAGTKMAGETWPVFAAEDGTSYIAVGDDLPRDNQRAKIRGRILEPDMTYTARMNGPDVWVLDIFDEGHVEDPAPRAIPCG